MAANPIVHPVTGRILETPELRERGLAALRGRMAEAVATRALERFPRDDDRFLLAFLRTAKYDVAKAFARVRNFAVFWYGHRDLIDGLCAARCRQFAELRMMQFLSGKDVAGNSLVALYMGALDPAKFSARAQMEFSVYMLASVFDDDEQQLSGVTYVETMAGFSLAASMGLSAKMSSKEQKAMMSLATSTFPLRIRRILVVEQVRTPPLHSGVVTALSPPTRRTPSPPARP
jgi:hypothetical protein